MTRSECTSVIFECNFKIKLYIVEGGIESRTPAVTGKESIETMSQDIIVLMQNVWPLTGSCDVATCAR